MIKEKITSILSEILGSKVSPEDIKNTTNLTSDLGLTSLDMMYFILEIENGFGIEIDLEKFDLATFFEYQKLKTFIKEETS